MRSNGAKAGVPLAARSKMKVFKHSSRMANEKPMMGMERGPMVERFIGEFRSQFFMKDFVFMNVKFNSGNQLKSQLGPPHSFGPGKRRSRKAYQSVADILRKATDGRLRPACATPRKLINPGRILPNLEVFNDRVAFRVSKLGSDHAMLRMPGIPGAEFVA
jgi:hypothetical protein